jgi:hypothetical protein
MEHVSVAAGLAVLDVGHNDVLMLWRDELDVEYVGLFDLMKP